MPRRPSCAGWCLGIAALLVAVQARAADPSHSVAFDVLNPKTVGGHRILHLADIVGTERRTDIPGLPAARAVLVFSATLEQCPPAGPSLCADVARLSALLTKEGGLVVGVLWAEREQAARAKREIPQSDHPFPIALDTYGVVRQALKLDRPGVFLVVHSSGENIRLSPPSNVGDRSLRERFLEEVRSAFQEAVQRDREEEE